MSLTQLMKIQVKVLEEIRNSQIQSHPVVSEGVQSQTVVSEGVQSHPVASEEVRSSSEQLCSLTDKVESENESPDTPIEHDDAETTEEAREDLQESVRLQLHLSCFSGKTRKTPQMYLTDVNVL